MKNMLLLVAAAGLLSLAAAQGISAAPGGTFVCTGDLFGTYTTFTGTTKDLIVPPGNACVLEGATVTHDVTVENGASFGMDNSTIGHDLKMDGPGVVEMYDWTGPNSVGHDVVISGSSANSAAYGGWDVCGTTIGHDLSITGGTVRDEIEVGDQGPLDNEFCEGSGTDSVSHDVTVSGNTAGKIDVGNNTVGHDLSVNNNKGVPEPEGVDLGVIGVDDNTVSHDATCTGNSPGLTADGPEDGPNHVGHKDTGCEAAHA